LSNGAVAEAVIQHGASVLQNVLSEFHKIMYSEYICLRLVKLQLTEFCKGTHCGLQKLSQEVNIKNKEILMSISTTGALFNTVNVSGIFWYALMP